MEIIKMLTKKNCYVGANAPSYVVLHETDNWDRGADAKRHAMAMQNGNLAGTVHYCVDSECVYQTLSHEDGAWAVGDGGGRYGITNHNSINIEIYVKEEKQRNFCFAAAGNFAGKRFKGKDGKELILDRTAGENAIYALWSYQESRKVVLEADGVCGSMTWKDLIVIQS